MRASRPPSWSKPSSSLGFPRCTTTAVAEDDDDDDDDEGEDKARTAS